MLVRVRVPPSAPTLEELQDRGARADLAGRVESRLRHQPLKKAFYFSRAPFL
jgi:hypothetical protein